MWPNPAHDARFALEELASGRLDGEDLPNIMELRQLNYPERVKKGARSDEQVRLALLRGAEEV